MFEEDADGVAAIFHDVVVILVHGAEVSCAVLSQAVSDPFKVNQFAGRIDEASLIDWWERAFDLLAEFEPFDGRRLQTDDALVSSLSAFGAHGDATVLDVDVFPIEGLCFWVFGWLRDFLRAHATEGAKDYG